MWVIVQACDNPTGSSGLTLTNTMLCSFLEKPCGSKGGGGTTNAGGDSESAGFGRHLADSNRQGEVEVGKAHAYLQRPHQLLRACHSPPPPQTQADVVSTVVQSASPLI
jgi:hypothetical protein